MSSELAELATWKRELLPDAGFVLTSPAGPAFVSLCVRPGVRRSRTLRQLVEDMADKAGRELQVARQIGPIQRIVTREGLHGAYVPLRAIVEGAALEWVIGVVVRDDEVVVVEGTGRGPHVRRWVASLMRGLPLGVAPDRVQMFPYRPPPGWLGVRRALATCWLAPRFPRDPAVLIVCDAVPAANPTAIDLLWPAPHGGDRKSIELQHLRGVRAVDRDVVAVDLADSRYRYRVILRAGMADDLVTFEQLVASIEPCPAVDDRRDAEVFAWMI